MTQQEDCLAQIRNQLDAIQKSLNAIEVSQGITNSLHQRYDISLRDIEVCLKGKVSKEDSNEYRDKIAIELTQLRAQEHEMSKVLSQYEGDRKFVLGIVATITVIMGAINGIAIRMTSNYFDELEASISRIDRATKERYEQSVFDSTKNASDISSLKDRMIELNKKGN